jgi:hypothetical protein
MTRPIRVDPSNASVLQTFGYIGRFILSIGLNAGLLWLAVGVLAFLPSVLLIGLAEMFGIRAAVYYAIAGTIAAVTAQQWPISPQSFGLTGGYQNPFDWVGIVLGISGLAGGVAYWRFAGRKANGVPIPWQRIKSKARAILGRPEL